MESFKEFKDRINAFETREIDLGREYFNVNHSLVHKVGKNNRFKPFFGDTVVFDLGNSVKAQLSAIEDELYGYASACFCERLDAETFHVTLHDLCNSEHLRNISEDLFYNELNVISKISEARNSSDRITFRSKFIFNMVNTSLVMGLYPSDEGSYERLMALYSLFDNIKKLDYPFTPHITLAYYNVNGFDARAAVKLKSVVERLNSSLEMEFRPEKLVYQKFTSMNDYFDIIEF